MQNLFEELSKRLPPIAHHSLGGECGGCFIVIWKDPDRVKLVCDECGLIGMTTATALLFELVKLVPPVLSLPPEAHREQGATYSP